MKRVGDGTAILELASGLIDRLNQVDEDLINAKYKLDYYAKMPEVKDDRRTTKR